MHKNNSFINLLFSLNRTVLFTIALRFSLLHSLHRFNLAHSLFLYILSSTSLTISYAMVFRCGKTIAPLIATKTHSHTQNQMLFISTKLLHTRLSFFAVSHCFWFINYSFYACAWMFVWVGVYCTRSTHRTKSIECKSSFTMCQWINRTNMEKVITLQK